MRDIRTGGLLAATLLLAACGDEAAEAPAAEPAATASPSATGGSAAADWAARSWDLQASGEGTALVFPTGGEAAVRLFCPAGSGTILVNVPGFSPVGSEERMTFGSGGTVHTLVADTRGDRQRGGVSGSGPVAANLAALLGGPVAVNYGAQDAGPYPAPPAGLVRSFAGVCTDSLPAAPVIPLPAHTPTAKPTNVSACLIQGDERLNNPPLRAVGTEPFWGAKIEGRCVTYSHPEDQQGTRVWTRYTPRSSGGGTWRGALYGKAFELTARPEPGCSDGMSDNRYPYAVELLVNGERRTGCAEGV
jgi:uncharacterized membrane protein